MIADVDVLLLCPLVFLVQDRVDDRVAGVRDKDPGGLLPLKLVDITQRLTAVPVAQQLADQLKLVLELMRRGALGAVALFQRPIALGLQSLALAEQGKLLLRHGCPVKAVHQIDDGGVCNNQHQDKGNDGRRAFAL